MSVFNPRLLSKKGNLKNRIITSSPHDILISTVQDVLITKGYLFDHNPCPQTLIPMSAGILDTFEIVLSNEKKTHSLIQKQTSNFKIDNPNILDPQISLVTQIEKTTKELGMTFDIGSTLFEQDYKLTTNEEILYKQNKSTLKNSASGLSFIALFFCGEQLGALTRDNKYMIDKEKYTKILVQGTGRSAKNEKSMIIRPSALEQHICRGVGSI
tara:strand:+ start:50651 stop:51289 length:639 start_codon:yes stop_codon:yes gene_type:complete